MTVKRWMLSIVNTHPKLEAQRDDRLCEQHPSAPVRLAWRHSLHHFVSKPGARHGKRWRIFSIGSILFAFLALVVFLWPVTDTWYLGDDPYIGFQAEAVAQRGDSPLGFLLDVLRDTAGQGRFAPLAALSMLAFWLTPSVFIYKVGVIVVAMLSVALTAVLLSRLGFSAPHAALLPLVLCAIVQLRYWHDPVLAYAAGLPIVACLITGSLVALAEAIRRRRLTLYVMALTLFFAGCLYYEGTALLVPVVVPVAWSLGDDSIVAIVRRTAPFFGVAAVSIGLVLGLRAGAPADPTAKLYRPSLAPSAVASGLAKQVSGSLPELLRGCRQHA